MNWNTKFEWKEEEFRYENEITFCVEDRSFLAITWPRAKHALEPFMTYTTTCDETCVKKEIVRLSNSHRLRGWYLEPNLRDWDLGNFEKHESQFESGIWDLQWKIVEFCIFWRVGKIKGFGSCNDRAFHWCRRMRYFRGKKCWGERWKRGFWFSGRGVWYLWKKKGRREKRKKKLVVMFAIHFARVVHDKCKLYKEVICEGFVGVCS